MPGLLNQQGAQGAQAMPNEMSQEMPQEQAQGQELEATPEEQAIFEKYIAASIGAILNNRDTFQKLMKALEASKPTPVEGLSRIALSMYEKAENKLGPLDDEDLTEAVGEAIIEELLDLAVNAKVFTD